MRLVLWNCNGGIGSKEQSDVLKSLSPDVAVIPEMRQSNIDIFSPNSAIWKTNNRKQKSPKGLGVISFNGFHLDLLDYDEEMEIYLPIKIANNDFKINLLAIWNFYFASKQGRFRNVKGQRLLLNR